jgi:1,2-diacylglycerol 3-beta-galactosyltransferase
MSLHFPICCPRRNILILMSDTGGGHRAAAEAIANALEREFPNCYQIEYPDVIRNTARFPFNHAADMYTFAIAHAARFYGATFHFTNHPRVAPFSLRFVTSVTARGLRRLLRDASPDLVVSVHPLFSIAPRRVLRDLGSRAPFVIVVTDLIDTHQLWFDRDADLCIVPTTKARENALAAGIVSEKIRVVGVPVGLAFAAQAENQSSQRAYRSRLLLDPNCTTALLVGGGEGMGNLLQIARAIASARLPLQLIIIAGRNEALRKKLMETDWEIPVSVQGFVTDMPDWMRASDLIITKAGPATICEAIACGLPILLSGYLPGQEEGNVMFVEQEGIGAVRETPEGIAQTLGEWLEPGNDTLARFAENARRAARPRAVLDIAHILSDILHAQDNS